MSNPSRIRLGRKELCVFRDDLSHLTRESINKLTSQDNHLVQQLAKTILSQRHLIPSGPILHSLAPFLRLFPLPHLVSLFLSISP